MARRLVHRPQAGGPSSSQGTPGLLPNGVFDASNVQQQQQPAQQSGVQPENSNPQMMLSAYPGAQSAQQGSGMIPTPNTGVTDTSDMLTVKAEPGSSTANGVVPLEGAADPSSSSLQRGSMAGMVPVSGMMGSSATGSALMSNGAPVLIKQDNWSMPSPSMVPVSSQATGMALP